jgi:gamma-glutamyl-gamma-aminobutyrate hydrolase PuuD
MASASAPDGVIEAFEWADGTLGGKPFLLAVQWHPERMEYDNPLSLPIAQAFVGEVAAYEFLIRR